MSEWSKGYFFGCTITLWLIWLTVHLSGCASPYYSGTTAQHMIPCDQDNCGQKP